MSWSSALQCSGDVHRNSCTLSPDQYGERDALAAIRMILSTLSILGSVSIIASAIARRQVWSPKVHPIFQLSVADCLLSFLWVIGGALWFRANHDRVGCLAVALLTVMLECVTINLVLVYALSAHTLVTKRNVNNVIDSIYNITEQVWNPITSCVIYITAWILPVLILMVTFGGLAGSTSIVSGASECSCWCIPELGNVLPYAIPRDQPTAVYVWHIAKLVVAFGSLLFLNYLTVFVLLIILYWRIMRHISTLREGYANVNSGLGNEILQRAHSTAKKRIIYYLSTFIVLGFANVFLALLAVIYEGIRLRQGPIISTSYHLHTGVGSTISHEFHIAIHMIQSVTVPLQGFINAIVYGWTREDFLASMGITNSKTIRGEDGELEVSICREDDTENLINEGGGEEEMEQTLNLTEHEHTLSIEGTKSYQSI